MRADLKKFRQGKHKAEQELSRAKKRRNTGGVGGNKSNKFDPQNPTQQLTYKAYQRLTAEENDLTGEARKKAGVPSTRKVGSVTTISFAEGNNGEEGAAVPTAGVSPTLLASSSKKVSLTQRSATYSSKKKGDE